MAKRAENTVTTSDSKATALIGAASFYGNKFQGRRTANGEKFDNHAFTAAHKTLRFGSRVKVINVRNGLSVIVRVNDRGPFIRGRIIDLSKAAAKKIGLTHSGTVIVRLEIIH
jgi:rare lipoprotein A